MLDIYQDGIQYTTSEQNLAI